MNIKIVVVGVLDTNCYIVENDCECLIIDPGAEADNIINNIDKRVIGILLTHRHFDHIGAVEKLSSYYNINIYDYSNLIEGFNNIGCFRFFVQYNLGHTMDSISFIFDSVMFCGDFIFKDGIGRCDLGGNYNLMKDSIKKLVRCKKNYLIYPGHGDKFYLNEILNTIKTYCEL